MKITISILIRSFLKQIQTIEPMFDLHICIYDIYVHIKLHYKNFKNKIVYDLHIFLDGLCLFVTDLHIFLDGLI